MNRETRDHGNIEHARYRTKRNKAKTQHRHNNTKMSNTDPSKNRGDLMSSCSFISLSPSLIIEVRVVSRKSEM